MKKLIIILSFSSFVIAQNSFNVNTQSIGVNSSFFVEIALDNASEVTAFQFDISHTESAYELSNTSALTSRAENHTLSVSTIDDNTIRVLVYSAANELISVGDGAILNLSFNSKNEPGTYNLNLSNIVLSDVNGASLGVSSISGSVTILGPRYNLVTSSVNFGEIPMESSPTQSVSVSNTGNQDLIISGHILDTPFSINQSYPATISPGNSSSFTINADTSSKQVISKELSFTTNDQDALRALQTTTIQADIFAVNEIYIGSGQGESNTQITIPVSISNMEPFSGFQFDVTLPNDVSYVENSAAFTTRASDHNIAANMIDSNTLRFVSYSGSNANFLGNDGEVFSFKVIPNITSGTYTLPISNSIISNVELGDILSEAYNGSFTINAPYLSTSIQTINYGSVPITETRTTNITLTNTGSAELVIDELVFDASALSFPLTIPTILAVGESTPVELIFDPIQLGSFNQDISIRNNSPEEQQIITVLAEVFSPNFLRLQDKDVYRNNSYDIDINLVNNDNIRAIQFDLNIPEGFTFDYNDVIETSILNNFTTSISLLSNGNYRFVIYTLSNNIIFSGNETILKLPVFVENSIALGQYTFDFSNIVLSSESNQNISSEALSIGYINVIEDNTVPVITLLGDETVTIEVGTAYTDAGATALDNYDGDLTSSIVVTGSVDINTVGTYTVSYDVTDANGNVATTVIRTVNVVDTTVPVITLLGDETVTIEVGTAYTDAGATALDNYDGDLTSSIVVTGSVDINTVGTYTVSYDVTDANGNVATTVIRTVNVVDTTVPVITLLGDETVTIEVGTAYTDAGATALDNYDGDLTSSIVVTGSVDINTVGTYTVSYDVTDANGNVATTVIRTVNVVDTTVPVITLLGDETVTIEVGTAYTDAGATALDNYDGDLTSSIVVTGSVDINTVGTYTVSYDVTDANGNVATTVIRTVNVVDTTVPVITLLGDETVTIEVGTAYTDAGATALDNYDGDLTSSIVVTGSVDINTVGTYTVSYDVTDANGNVATTVIRTVNVVDTTVPVITLLGDETVTIEVGTAYTDAGATALDNYDGDLTSSIVVTGSVDINTVGTYTVSYDVTDANGNVATTVIRTVNVVDTTVPVITLLGDETVTIEVGTAYTDAGATALDNYDGDLTSSIVVTGSVDINTVGTYTVSYDVTDANGNVATTVIRTVNVVDTTVPVITLLGDETVTIEVGTAYTDAGATALDNYDGDLTSSIVVTGSVDINTVGTYTVSYDVTDANGNVATTVIRTVNVVESLSIDDNDEIKLSIFPNPTSTSWHIKSSKIIESLDLFDLTGKRLIHRKTFSNDIRLDATNLPNGIYLILINNNKTVRLIKK